ncbi:MAG: isoleucine--tRNA ligase [bacterium]
MSRGPVFAPISPQCHFPDVERDILAYWTRIDAFRRQVEQRPDDSRYVFYDGPPFATGLPHYGHLVASTLKDIVPRYWAMRGHRVERRFGWDTHGLPIEMEMEKALGLQGPTSIREYGVAEFNEACRSNVLRYTAEWERIVGRLGRWVDFQNDYKTMDRSFMETVWWVFAQLWQQGLVYEDFRVMPFSWRLSTSLSNFEANLDYRMVQDPAITVTMPLRDAPKTALLVWTTTPWTLPSNLAVAIGDTVEYIYARRPGDDMTYVIARARLHAILGKHAEEIASAPISELIGREYTPLFDYFADRPHAFRVIRAPHVTADDGTGLVHMAPDFGEDDYTACKAEGIDVLLTVDDEGRFDARVRDFAGRNIKEADPDIIRHLKAAGRLLRHDTIDHSYPFCWRSDTPLIYKAVPARFVRVEKLRERMSAHNDTIHWVPEAVGSKRFGNWLADARDWNVSRNRFWGTPLPVWRCAACADETCFDSVAALQAATGAAIEDIHPHRIDHLTFACEKCGGEKRRIPDVFDCWFESGSMPYAQDHYPFENKERFERNFPAQFIAEGLDQTRGWFYTLLVLSTALFDRPPFQNCVVNGMVLAEDGSKMSKRKQNYPSPERIFDEYGADALRAYLINSPIVRAEPLRFSEDGVREVVRTVLIPLRNAWSFLVQYANIDGWHPVHGIDGTPTPPVSERPELDRWLQSVLQTLVREVNTQMEGYYLYRVIPPVLGFIDDLTNWYIRRSRRRFWRPAGDPAGRADKAAAYATLHETLVTFAKVLAPILPFVTESLYQNLAVEPGVAEHDSVHLCDYPEVDASRIDTALERQIAEIRRVVTLGRALRERHQLKVRQPLRRLTVVHHDTDVLDAIKSHAELIAEELNIKQIALSRHDDDLATLSFKPDYKQLGRKLGKQMKAAAATIATWGANEWATLRDGGTLDVEGTPISAADVIIHREPRDGVVIEVDAGLTVAFDTTLDDSLIAEGLAREVVSRLQKLRKESGLEVTDRVVVELYTADHTLARAIVDNAGWIGAEVLAAQMSHSPAGAGEHTLDLEGRPLGVTLRKA